MPLKLIQIRANRRGRVWCTELLTATVSTRFASMTKFAQYTSGRLLTFVPFFHLPYQKLKIMYNKNRKKITIKAGKQRMIYILKNYLYFLLLRLFKFFILIRTVRTLLVIFIFCNKIYKLLNYICQKKNIMIHVSLSFIWSIKSLAWFAWY